MYRRLIIPACGLLFALILTAGSVAALALPDWLDPELYESEPNNTQATADPLPPGPESIYGEIGTAADVDFIRFDVARTSPVYLQAKAPYSLNGDEYDLLDTATLKLVNASGQTLAEADRELEVTLQPGTYAVSVRGKNDTGFYYLERRPGTIDETEPNNGKAAANSILLNAWIRGEFDEPETTADLFKFDGLAGDRVLLRTGQDYDEARGITMELLDSALQLLGKDTGRVVATLPATGVYYVRITPEPADWGSDGYKFNLELNPDDTLEGATPLDFFDPAFGIIVGQYDNDMFRFEGRAADLVRLSVMSGVYDSDDNGLTVKLLDASGARLVGSGDYESMGGDIAYLLPSDGIYYVSVLDSGQDVREYGAGYQLDLWRQESLYVSASADGLGGNAAIKKGDIATRDIVTGQWVLVFDASDMGITQNINAFEFTSADRLLFAIQASQTVPGVGKVTPRDILRFTPGSFGANTAGTLSFYMKGADVGLTTSGESIDALAWSEAYPIAGSQLLVSTTGSGKVPQHGGGTLSFADEDLIALVQSGTGQPVTGSWQLSLDGSTFGGMAVEDLGAATQAPAMAEWYDYSTDLVGFCHQTHLLASLPGAWVVDGIKGGPRDVLRLCPDNYYSLVSMQAKLLASKAIDGLAIGPLWTP